MYLWDRDNKPLWVNSQKVIAIQVHPTSKGYVYLDVEGNTIIVSPFKPQERNDEAFMSALTESTTLNEALLAMED